MYNQAILHDLLHLYDLRMQAEQRYLYEIESELVEVCDIVLRHFTRLFGNSDLMADSAGDVLVAEDENPEESCATNQHGEKDSREETLVGQA